MLFLGYLTKEGGKGFFRNWKRRWCVLDPDQAALRYYETTDTSKQPNGVVLLEGTEVKTIPKSERGKDNCLMISGPNRTFYAYADSADEINSWVTAIQEVFEIIKLDSIFILP